MIIKCTGCGDFEFDEDITFFPESIEYLCKFCFTEKIKKEKN